MDYNQDFEAAKKWYKIVKEQNNQQAIDILEELFPKLKKNEDERIKNLIYCLIRDRNDNVKLLEQNGVTVEEALAWLEKQGKETSEKEFTFKALPRLLEMIEVSDRAKAYTEKLAVALDNEGYHTDAKIVRESIKIMNGEEVLMATMDEQKPVDNIEPKFKVGDWITNGDYTWKIAEVKPLDYILQSQDGNIVDDTISHVDEQFHSFTIKDAKDGDVLATPNYIYIFNSIDKETETVAFYCLIKKSDKHFSFGDYRIHDEILNSTPATKKQYDILIKAMTDSGYTFNFEKKELKKIKQKSQRMVSAEAKEALYDKPTDEEMKELLRTEYEKGRADTIAETKLSWSEEDERMLDGIIDEIEANKSNAPSYDIPVYEGFLNWLKSLKDRVIPQPKQEWSEEDERLLESTTAFIEANNTFCSWKGKSKKDILPWLKSLKERIKL